MTTGSEDLETVYCDEKTAIRAATEKNIEESKLDMRVKLSDSDKIDAFGRLRVSNPHTIFDSKQIYTNLSDFFDDAEVSGSGTSSSHSTATASTTISVSNLTAGKRVRQSYRRYNYSPGKSQLILMTAQLGTPASGITARVGLFDDNDGLFFESKDGAVNVVRRSSASGSPVDERISSSDFNIDTMDGNGESGIVVDPTKVQILVLDFSWLGSGRQRLGFEIGGKIIWCHHFKNSNVLETVWCSSPNLPIRYSIENDGTGPASSMQHICATIMQEGGEVNGTGIYHFHSNGNTAVSMATAGTTYPLLAFRLKSDRLGTEVKPIDIHLLSTTADDYLWSLILNPTVSGGSFSFSSHSAASSVEHAVGTGSLTLTGGHYIDGGFVSSAQKGGDSTHSIDTAQLIGAAIDGTRDVLVLAAMPLGSGTVNGELRGSMTWKESL